MLKLSKFNLNTIHNVLDSTQFKFWHTDHGSYKKTFIFFTLFFFLVLLALVVPGSQIKVA
jgi:hypothetical protein